MILSRFFFAILLLGTINFSLFAQESKEGNQSREEAMLYLQQGGIVNMKGKYQEAADLYLKAALLLGNSAPSTFQSSSKEEAIGYLEQGGVAYSEERYQDAADHYLKAALLLEENAPSNQSTSQEEFIEGDEGDEEFIEGEYEEDIEGDFGEEDEQQDDYPGKDEVAAWYKTGEEYYFGDNGRAVDYSLAAEWLTKAADNGHENGQHILAGMYNSGQGVALDRSKALSYYLLAAEQGNAKSQTLLGLAYYSGDGVSIDKWESLKWHQLAADQNIAISQRYVASLYSSGDVIPKDLKQAFIYAFIGNFNKDEKSLELLKLIIQEVGQETAESWTVETTKKYEEIINRTSTR